MRRNLLSFLYNFAEQQITWCDGLLAELPPVAASFSCRQIWQHPLLPVVCPRKNCKIYAVGHLR